MTSSNKETIYIDVDEDITSIVNKIQGSSKNIIALVLPKRATVFQSIVNMRLIKRTSENSDKNVVLITSENTVLPLAGAAGVYVAANLNSKPYIPEGPEAGPVDTEDDANMEEVDIDPNTPIGDLVEDEEPGTPSAAAKSPKPSKKAKKSGKKPKVPNFNSFRKKLIIGGVALLALIGLVYLILFVLPKATITLKTEASELPISLDFTLDADSTSVDLEGKTLPSVREEKSISETETVPATGQRDKGNKASGSVNMSIACSAVSGAPPTIPAGTGVSSGGLTFITQSAVSLTDPDFSNGCRFTGSTNVLAQENGDQYNVGARSYTVAGFSNVQANGSAMTGGSSRMVKVVTAKDIETARNRFKDKEKDIIEELSKKMQENDLVAIRESFDTSKVNFSNSAQPDAEANEVTVTASGAYSMLGVKKDDLKELIKDSVKEQVESLNQSILDEGIEDAKFTIASGSASDGEVAVSLSTDVVIGPEINQEEIKEELAGKKTAEAESFLSTREGITEAQVKLSPFWVTKVPGKASNVVFVIEQADGTQINTEP